MKRRALKYLGRNLRHPTENVVDDLPLVHVLEKLPNADEAVHPDAEEARRQAHLADLGQQRGLERLTVQEAWTQKNVN